MLADLGGDVYVEIRNAGSFFSEVFRPVAQSEQNGGEMRSGGWWLVAGGWWLVAGGVISAWAVVPGSAVLTFSDATLPVTNVGLTVDSGDRYVGA